ncbi:MAG: MFS transporter [Dehalococcoidales bacterium]|nr:MFS transporter [Dehalococcoidales bacterium]
MEFMDQGTGIRPATYRWYVLLLSGLGSFFAVGLSWYCMAGLFYEIAQTTGWSMAQLFTAWGMIPLAAAVMSIPSGVLCDRYGTRLVCGVGIILAGVMGALRGLSGNFPVLVVTMALYGGVSALAAVNLPKAVATWFPPHQMGTAMSGYLFIAGAGSAVSLMVSGTVVSSLLGGWRQVTFLCGLLTVIIGIIWLFTIKERKIDTTDVALPNTTGGELSAPVTHPNIMTGFVSLFRLRDSWILSVVYFLFMGGWVGASGTLPFLLEEAGWSKFQANFVVSSVLWTYIAGSLIFPALSDKLGLRRIVFTVCTIISGTGMFLCFLLPSPWIWVAAVAWGLFAGGVGLIVAVPMELPGVGIMRAGSLLGLIMASGYTGGFLFSLFVPPLAGISLVLPGILCGFGGYALSGGLFLLVTETGHRAKAKAVVGVARNPGGEGG